MEGLTDCGGSGGPGSGCSLSLGGTWWEVDRAGTWRVGQEAPMPSARARPGLVGGVTLPVHFPHVSRVQGPHFLGPRGLHPANAFLRGPAHHLREFRFDLTPK